MELTCDFPDCGKKFTEKAMKFHRMNHTKNHRQQHLFNRNKKNGRYEKAAPIPAPVPVPTPAKRRRLEGEKGEVEASKRPRIEDEKQKLFLSHFGLMPKTEVTEPKQPTPTSAAPVFRLLRNRAVKK